MSENTIMSLRLPRDQKLKLEETARREGMTVSEYCRQAIYRALDEDMTKDELEEIWDKAEKVEVTTPHVVHSPTCDDPKVSISCSNGCCASCVTCGWGKGQYPCPASESASYRSFRFRIPLRRD